MASRCAITCVLLGAGVCALLMLLHMVIAGVLFNLERTARYQTNVMTSESTRLTKGRDVSDTGN